MKTHRFLPVKKITSMHELTLGQALAYLEIELMGRKAQPAEPFAPSENIFLQNLRSRLQNMQHSHAELLLSTDVPKHECHSATPYLADNSDFFLAHILIRKGNSGPEPPFKHLNDCFNCFEIYCQVMQDYYHTCQEIITTNRVRGFQS